MSKCRAHSESKPVLSKNLGNWYRYDQGMYFSDQKMLYKNYLSDTFLLFKIAEV